MMIVSEVIHFLLLCCFKKEIAAALLMKKGQRAMYTWIVTSNQNKVQKWALPKYWILILYRLNFFFFSYLWNFFLFHFFREGRYRSNLLPLCAFIHEQTALIPAVSISTLIELHKVWFLPVNHLHTQNYNCLHTISTQLFSCNPFLAQRSLSSCDEKSDWRVRISDMLQFIHSLPWLLYISNNQFTDSYTRMNISTENNLLFNYVFSCYFYSTNVDGMYAQQRMLFFPHILILKYNLLK